MTTQRNTGHLCSVYCPGCGKVTDKISWNLLREALRVDVTCPVCCDTTRLEYQEGSGVSVLHGIDDSRELAKKILKAEDNEDANLTLEKIQELHDGVEKRIDELSEKALARLAEQKKK